MTAIGRSVRARRSSEPLLEFDPASFTGPDAGVKRLAYAVLNDALTCILGVGRGQERIKERRDARAWFLSGERDWLFSFGAICDLLQLPEDRIRDVATRDPRSMHALPNRFGAVRRRLRPLPVRAIRKRVAAGESLISVAKFYGTEQRKISKIASDIVERRQRDRNKQIWVEYHVHGRSLGDIALRLGLSKSSVGRICKTERDARARLRAVKAA